MLVKNFKELDREPRKDSRAISRKRVVPVTSKFRASTPTENSAVLRRRAPYTPSCREVRCCAGARKRGGGGERKKKNGRARCGGGCRYAVEERFGGWKMEACEQERERGGKGIGRSGVSGGTVALREDLLWGRKRRVRVWVNDDLTRLLECFVEDNVL